MDVPSGMVDLVARAIYEAKRLVEGVDSTWDEVKDRASRPDGYAYAKLAYDASTKAARAAIEAMMEPSKAMVFFGMDAMSRDDLEPTEDEFRAGFQAAIRSALGTTFPALSPSLKEQERT